MANLIESVQSAIPIGTIIEAMGPPDSTWKKCNGDVLNQADYPAYVANAYELHPNIWKNWDFVSVDQSGTGQLRRSMSNIGDLIVCVGNGSRVWRSADGGLNWTTNDSLSTGNHYQVANNGTRFVTVQNNSSNAYYSSDGENWTQTTLPSSSYWTKICYANGYFTIIYSSTVLYSTDGITWNSTTHSLGYVALLYSANNILFAFSSNSGQYRLHTSTDGGQTWSSGTSDFFHGSPYYNNSYPLSLFYLNGEYIMFWGQEDRFFLRHVGGDVKESDNWIVQYCPQFSDIYYFEVYNAIWTGEHYLIPNADTSYDDGMVVGKSLNSLNLYRNGMLEVNGIVHDADNWVVVLPETTNYTSVGRCTGVPYDKATKFQLPHELMSRNSRIYKYIKVAE